jgi:hypothetical protein
MDIKAKPTEYAGVLFRSKLEATWARFFDVIGIKWEYEPTQLPGWIPDFLIDGWWLAEVKPIPVMWGDVPSHPPFAKAIRDFDTVLLGDGPGDALGLVVRRLATGKVFTRRLCTDLNGKSTELYPTTEWKPEYFGPLMALWAGVVQSSTSWRQVGTAMDGDA